VEALPSGADEHAAADLIAGHVTNREHQEKIYQLISEIESDSDSIGEATVFLNILVDK
jgi:hypothetical protein